MGIQIKHSLDFPCDICDSNSYNNYHFKDNDILLCVVCVKCLLKKINLSDSTSSPSNSQLSSLNDIRECAKKLDRCSKDEDYRHKLMTVATRVVQKRCEND